MNKVKGVIMMSGFLLSLLTACFGASSIDSIHIRIRNDSRHNIENFWLGAGRKAGGDSRAYGAISSGETTKYIAIKPIYANYRRMNMTIDNVRYWDEIVPSELLGVQELSSGNYYTFVYTIVGDEAVLRIIEETVPSN